MIVKSTEKYVVCDNCGEKERIDSGIDERFVLISPESWQILIYEGKTYNFCNRMCTHEGIDKIAAMKIGKNKKMWGHQ